MLCETWNECRWIVFKRDNFQCQKCGAEGTDPAHIFYRRYKEVLLESDNIILLCHHCHMEWSHKNIKVFHQWVKDRIRENRWIKIEKMAKQNWASEMLSYEETTEIFEEAQ